jgi:hypothetical protein
MNPNDRLEALLDDWQEAEARGLLLSPKDLCGDTPELLPELTRRIQVLRCFQALRSEPSASSVTQQPEKAEAEPESTAGLSTVEHHPVLTNTMSDPQHHLPAPAGPPSATLPVLGSTFGGYRLVAELGRGGMGCVFRATEIRLQRDVALKVIQPNIATRPDSLKRFLREAVALAAVRSDHVVEIYQVGEVNGMLFVAMPLLEGETLAARLQRDRLLPATEVLRVGREIAEGLVAVHARGLIHRDIKPANVWLEAPNRRVKLLDFGLVRDERQEERLTGEIALLGTPPYMSPEQVDSEDLDARSDLFSLGSVLYECATGQRAFPGSTLTAILNAVGKAQPPAARSVNPAVPAGLSDLIALLLKKDREQRPPSAQDLVERIRQLERGDTLPPLPKPGPGLSRPWWIGLAALVGVALLGALCALLYHRGTGNTGDRSGGTGPTRITETKATPTAVAALGARLDLRIWKKDDKTKGLTLGDKGALPLAPGDWMRVEARSNHPAYFYLVYLDADGRASPMSPWRGNDWNHRPPEQLLEKVNLPEDPEKDAGPLENGASGIEAVLLLARAEPLSDAEVNRLRQLLDKAPEQGKFDPLRGAVWLGSDTRFGIPEERGRLGSDGAGKAADPVERVRRLVRNELKDLGGEVCGVCYPFRGE